MPYKREVAKTKKKIILPPAGYMHCGCNENVVLTDFYFWKTWTLTCLETGKAVTESLRDQRLLPRERAFIVAHYEKVTGLTIDDLYSGARKPEDHERHLLKLQAERLLQKVKEMDGESGEE